MRMLIVAEPQLGWPGKWEEREAIRAAHVRAVGDRFCKCLHRTRRKPATGEWATDANVTEVVTGRRARGALPRRFMFLVPDAARAGTDSFSFRRTTRIPIAWITL